MQYLTSNSRLPPYMAFPRFLLEHQTLNETAKLIYVLLLDRARVSIKNDGWADEQGRVYLNFTIEALSKESRKSLTTVKTALAALEREELIVRVRQGIGFPNRIYVKIPDESWEHIGRKQSTGEPKNGLSHGWEADRQADEKPTRSNKEYRNNHLVNQKRNIYGSYNNVFLSDDEIESLKHEILRLPEFIERLSSYMKSSGKRYEDHAATILNWAQRDGYMKRKYEYSGEWESL